MGVIRQTKSVKAILNAFEITDSAISSTHLVKQFSDQMNKTTVYRILDRLVDEGMLHSFKGNDGVSLFAKIDKNTAHSHSDFHPHFQCKQCGETKCVPIDVEIPSLPDYQVENVELLISGTCDKCK